MQPYSDSIVVIPRMEDGLIPEISPPKLSFVKIPALVSIPQLSLPTGFARKIFLGLCVSSVGSVIIPCMAFDGCTHTLPLTDSKVLSEERRDELFEAIQCRNEDLLGWKVEVLSPNAISNAMLQR